MDFVFSCNQGDIWTFFFFFLRNIQISECWNVLGLCTLVAVLWLVLFFSLSGDIPYSFGYCIFVAIKVITECWNVLGLCTLVAVLWLILYFCLSRDTLFIWILYLVAIKVISECWNVLGLCMLVAVTIHIIVNISQYFYFYFYFYLFWHCIHCHIYYLSFWSNSGFGLSRGKLCAILHILFWHYWVCFYVSTCSDVCMQSYLLYPLPYYQFRHDIPSSWTILCITMMPWLLKGLLLKSLDRTFCIHALWWFPWSLFIYEKLLFFISFCDNYNHNFLNGFRLKT